MSGRFHQLNNQLLKRQASKSEVVAGLVGFAIRCGYTPEEIKKMSIPSFIQMMMALSKNKESSAGKTSGLGRFG